VHHGAQAGRRAAGSQNVNTIRALLRCLAACLLVSLAACGGGGGSPGTRGGGSISGGGAGGGGSGSGSGGTTPVAAKYVGTWVRCIANGSKSVRDTLALNLSTTTPNALEFNEVFMNFDSNNTCNGSTASSQSTINGTVQFVGITKTIGSDTVDEAQVTQTPANGVLNQVFTLRASTNTTAGNVKNLFIGLTGRGESVDANGYPNALDPNFYAP
jgi:hypothetical protein